ncbi:hypothetical protein BG015_011697, partial [Linnemannia schmuckeri]
MLGAAQSNASTRLPGGNTSEINPQQPATQAHPVAVTLATPAAAPIQGQSQTQPASAPAGPSPTAQAHPTNAQAQPAATLPTQPVAAQAQPAVAPPAPPATIAASLAPPAAAQVQPSDAPKATATPKRGPLPKSLVAGLMAALVAATTPSQSNSTLPTLEATTLAAFTAAVAAAESLVERLPLLEPTLATALAVIANSATTLAGQRAVQHLSPLLFEQDPNCPFKEFTFNFDIPRPGSHIDALHFPRHHRPKLHSKRRRLAVAQYQSLQFPLPLNQQLQRQTNVQWKAVNNFIYARQERYAKMRAFQSRLATTLNPKLGTGSWRLRLNKRVQKKIFSDRLLSPEKLQLRQKSTSLRGDDIEGVPYRVKDLKGWIRDADRFRTQLGSKRARWNKTKLQYWLTQGSDVRSRLRGPLVFGLLDQQAGYVIEKLVRDRFAFALSYAIEQQMGAHKHYKNRLIARMKRHFLHKLEAPNTSGRRGGDAGGVNWLTPEMQGLFNQITLVHRNEQTIHQKALDEMAQQQIVSRQSWDLLTKQRWEWHRYEREALRVHCFHYQEEWKWRLRLQDPETLKEMRLWSRTIFVRPNPPSLTDIAALAPPIPEYSCPIPELLHECSPEAMVRRCQHAVLQQTIAHEQEYETRLAECADRILQIKHTGNLEWEKLERKRVSARTQQQQEEAVKEIDALNLVIQNENLKVHLEENQLKLVYGQWKNDQQLRQLQVAQDLPPADQLRIQQQILQTQRQNQQAQQNVQRFLHTQLQQQQQKQRQQAAVVPVPASTPAVALTPFVFQPAVQAPPAANINQAPALLPIATFPITTTTNNLPTNYAPITTRTRKPTDEDIDMDYDPETAISQYKYTPLHSNPGIAATLATMNLEVAIKRLPAYNSSSIVRANLDHGYTHVIQCLLDGSCIPKHSPFAKSSTPTSFLPQLFPPNSFFRPAKQSLISRAGEAAIRAWIYIPKHSDPVTVLTLAYMDMLSASAAVGFSFCDDLEKMGHTHAHVCIPKEKERLEKLRKEGLGAAAAAAVAAVNQSAPASASAAPSVLNVFNFGTVPNGGILIQQPQPQPQQQPQRPTKSERPRPILACDSGYGPSPSPSSLTGLPAQANAQGAQNLAPPPPPAASSLPSAPASTPSPADAASSTTAATPITTFSEPKHKKDKPSKHVKSHKDSDNEDYQQRHRRAKKQKRKYTSSSSCRATKATKSNKSAKTNAAKKSKKTAEFKIWRTKELTRKRRTQEQYYFRRPVLSIKSLSPPSTFPTSPTSQRHVRDGDESSHVEETSCAQEPAVTLANRDEEVAKSMKRCCRRAMSEPAVSRNKTDMSLASVLVPAFELSKMERLLAPGIRNKQPLQLREQ